MFGSVSSMGTKRASSRADALFEGGDLDRQILREGLFRRRVLAGLALRADLLGKSVPLGARRFHQGDLRAALGVDRAPFLERAGRHVALPEQVGQALEFLSKKISRDHQSRAFCRARRRYSSGDAALYHRFRLTVPRVLVAIVSWNSAAHVADAVASVPAGVPVVVVDNASSDGSAEIARTAGARVIEAGTNLGFGPACNRAAREGAPSETVLFLNPDAALVDGRRRSPRCSRARRGPGGRRRRAAAHGRRAGALPAPPAPVARLARARGASRRPPLPGERRPSPRTATSTATARRPSTSSSPPPRPSSSGATRSKRFTASTRLRARPGSRTSTSARVSWNRAGESGTFRRAAPRTWAASR